MTSLSSPLYSFNSSPPPLGDRELNGFLDPAPAGFHIATRRLPVYPVVLKVQNRPICVPNSASQQLVPVTLATAALRLRSWSYSSAALLALAGTGNPDRPAAWRIAFSISTQRTGFSRRACLAFSRPCANRSSL